LLALTASGVIALQEGAADREGEDLPSLLCVPTGDDNAGRQLVLVVVALRVWGTTGVNE